MLDEVSAALNLAAASQVAPMIKRRSKARKRKRGGGELPGLEKAAGYVRVSMDKRKHKDSEGRPMAEEIVSPDTQERMARAYCESQGWDMVTVESDLDESGYRQHYSKRQGLMKLLAAVQRREITRIVVFKFNRLSRRLVEFTEILGLVEAAGAGVVSVSEQIDTSTPSGRMIRNIMASFAQYQSEELSEQIYETWLTKVKSGKRQPGRAPYGTVYNKGMLEPDPKTHPVLLAMYQHFAETRSVNAVVDYLTERRIPTALDEGGRWGQFVVRRILCNPAYIGQNWFDGELYDANWGPLLPVELWEDVQAILNGRRTEPRARVDSQLLRGHVICPDCGRPMWTQHSTRWQDGKRGSDRYYWCAEPKTGRAGCAVPAVHAAELEEKVWAIVRCLELPEDVDARHRDVGQGAASDPDVQQRGQLLRQKERLTQQVGELFELLTDKHITKQEFGERKQLYAGQLTEIGRDLEELQRQHPGRKSPAQIRAAVARADDAVTLEDRRQILAAIGVKISVAWDGIRWSIPDLDFGFRLRARLMGERWYLGEEYQRLDYQGTELTDKQIKFIQRTYGKFDKQAIARRLGKTYVALKSHVSRLRNKGVSIAPRWAR